MNKAESCQYLTGHDVSYELTEHQTVYTMGELSSVILLREHGNEVEVVAL